MVVVVPQNHIQQVSHGTNLTLFSPASRYETRQPIIEIIKSYEQQKGYDIRNTGLLMNYANNKENIKRDTFCLRRQQIKTQNWTYAECVD